MTLDPNDVHSIVVALRGSIAPEIFLHETQLQAALMPGPRSNL